MKTNLEQVLSEYLNVFPGENERLEKLKSLIQLNKSNYNNIFSRKNFVGHVTASGFIYSKKEKQLLLLEHKLAKRFLQPGGHVELSDNEIIETAEREIFEETGLKDLEVVNISADENVPFDIDTHYIPKNEKKNEEEHYHHDFRFLFAVDNIENVKIDNEESNGYKWIDIDSLRDNESFKKNIDKILELLNRDYNVI